MSNDTNSISSSVSNLETSVSNCISSVSQMGGTGYPTKFNADRKYTDQFIYSNRYIGLATNSQELSDLLKPYRVFKEGSTVQYQVNLFIGDYFEIKDPSIDSNFRPRFQIVDKIDKYLICKFNCNNWGNVKANSTASSPFMTSTGYANSFKETQTYALMRYLSPLFSEYKMFCKVTNIRLWSSVSNNYTSYDPLYTGRPTYFEISSSVDPNIAYYKFMPINLHHVLGGTINLFNDYNRVFVGPNNYWKKDDVNSTPLGALRDIGTFAYFKYYHRIVSADGVDIAALRSRTTNGDMFFKVSDGALISAYINDANFPYLLYSCIQLDD